MGVSKANLRMTDSEGLTFLDRSQALLQECCSTTLVLGSGLDSSVACCLEDREPFAGPWKALADALPKVSTQWVLLIPVDMPSLTSELLKQIQAAAEKEKSGFITSPEGQPAGFPVAIPRSSFAAIRKLHADGETSLFRGLKAVGLKAWKPTRPQLGLLQNINSPEQLLAWRAAPSSCKKAL